MATTQGPVIAALETTFTPPAACFTTLEAYIDRNTVLLVPLGITATQTDFGCWPPGYAQFQSTYTGSAQGYFSPGVCPSGFTSACPVAAATGPESAALCCPRGYTCTAGATGAYAGMSCKSTIVSTTAITAYTPNLVQSAWQSDRIVTVPAAQTTLALGYGIEVRWQSSDLSVFAGTPRTGSSTSTNTSTGTSTSSSTHTAPHVTATPDTHAGSAAPAMSPATKLAIGLAIPIVVILLLLIFAALCLIRRRRRQRHSPANKYQEPDGPPAPAELQGDTHMIEPKALKAELNARTPSPVEIDGRRVALPHGFRHPQQHPHVATDQRVSDTYTISPVGGSIHSPAIPLSPADIRHQRSVRLRRPSVDQPVPPAPDELAGRHRHSRSGSAADMVARTPSSVRRSSTDDRVPPVPVLVRRSVPRAMSESSAGGASEEEREVAERYRMFTTSS